MPQLLFFLVGTLAAFSVQAEIYRWVDEQGRVHFGERYQEGAQEIEVTPQIIERDPQVLQREDNLRRLMEVRREERSVENARLAEQRKKQQAMCQDMRQQLAQFDRRVFWYEKDASGKRREVDRQRVEARKAEIQNLVRERC
ncbi:MAG TPA: DUF4124 domain-containing protein [Pseudomonas xinjiangensis]|uniref:DUF4124 domain-containing protein n=2 Tax=root TaxID=1 RepID=A0A7V1FSB1_9GAMM|nr:DUF4124 domain-containing protein [Halopseudomonas xinjiangensis]HEC48242.1 DUF4124 domain-containing protein [Halopseudomonas xinjiangensis]